MFICLRPPGIASIFPLSALLGLNKCERINAACELHRRDFSATKCATLKMTLVYATINTLYIVYMLDGVM